MRYFSFVYEYLMQKNLLTVVIDVKIISLYIGENTNETTYIASDP